MRRLASVLAVACVGLFVVCGPDEADAGRLPWQHRKHRPIAPPDAPPVALLRILEHGSYDSLIASCGAVTGVTFARASAVLCVGDGGWYTSLASGCPCVETPGLRIEAAATNSVKRNTALENASWDKSSLTGVTPDLAIAPDNTLTADLVGSDGGTTVHLGQQLSLASAVRTYSFYVYPDSATFARVAGGLSALDSVWEVSNAVGFRLASTTSTTEPLHWIERMPNGWYRVTVVINDGGGQLQMFYGQTAIQAQGAFVDAGISIYAWGPQVESGQYPSSPILTTSAAVTRAAATAYATNPITNDAGTWCLRASATPDSRVWDIRGIVQGVLQLGDTFGAANTASLYVTDAGYPAFQVVDSVGGVKGVLGTTIVLPGKRVLRACDEAGTLSMSQGTTSLTTTDFGDGGSGNIATQPAKLYLGSLGATTQLGGTISDVCVTDRTLGCPASEAVPTPTYVARTISTFGDSITSAPAPTTSWPTILDNALDAGWVVTNYAAGSQTAEDELRVWHDAGVTAQYTTWMTGINDALSSTARLRWESQRAFLVEAWAGGTEPVIIHDTPWKNSPFWSAPRQTLYAAIQSYGRDWCTRTGQRCYDAYADLADAGDPAYMNFAYDYGDHVHPNDAGSERIADQVRQTLGL